MQPGTQQLTGFGMFTSTRDELINQHFLADAIFLPLRLPKRSHKPPWINFVPRLLIVYGVGNYSGHQRILSNWTFADIFDIWRLTYWTSMSWSIDTCQNKVSADQYHVTILRAQVEISSRSAVFSSWPLTRYWFPVGSQAQAKPKRGFIFRALSCGSKRLPLHQVNIFTVEVSRV